MGRIAKGVKCSVSACGKEAIRSISAEKVRSAGLKVGSGERRAYLCKEHYREYKKKTKKEKKVEQWRYKGV
ncbi:hypothetical protein KAU55_02265 [Candidatus Bathyarchaeota archaeon]|nr:hypothetical protein [Candidatus Bathyarchaeota archaeon]